jgi:hypothetical protein
MRPITSGARISATSVSRAEQRGHTSTSNPPPSREALRRALAVALAEAGNPRCIRSAHVRLGGRPLRERASSHDASAASVTTLGPPAPSLDFARDGLSTVEGRNSSTA